MSACDKGHLMAVEDALKQMLENCQPLSRDSDVEWVPITDCLGRVIAQDVVSTINVPPQDNSAVDGYALRSEDLQQGNRLKVSQRIPAGYQPVTLEPGTAARIFTGAFVPPGADAVVMQEDCEADGEFVQLPTEAVVGQNIRPAGQDIAKGDRVILDGHRLKPQDLGLMASLGYDELPVYRKLKVAILSTGDELLEPGETYSESKIYNSNRYTLRGLLDALRLEIVDYGIVEDTAEATEQALAKAAAEADVILTSGGVSVGEEDHIKGVIQKLGALNLWRLAIKPGKPLAFGHVNNTPIIGLPGNPVAVFVTFCIAARPWLLKAQGASRIEPVSFSVPLGYDVKKGAKRREFVRVRLESDEGRMVLKPYRTQSSGALSSVSWADGLAVIRENECPKTGDLVDYLPFSELLY